MRYDAVVIGGGRSGCAEALRRAAEGQKVCVVSTGLTLHSLEPELKDKPYALLHELTKAGIAVLRGDIAEVVCWNEGQAHQRRDVREERCDDRKSPDEGVAVVGACPLGGGCEAAGGDTRAAKRPLGGSASPAVCAIRTANGITLEAAEFVLATGRFFSRGLIADMEGVREPLFGADVDFPADRSKWFDPDFFAPQPFEGFGVKTDKKGSILKGGKAVENVFAIGKILGGKHNAGK